MYGRQKREKKKRVVDGRVHITAMSRTRVNSRGHGRQLEPVKNYAGRSLESDEIAGQRAANEFELDGNIRKRGRGGFITARDHSLPASHPFSEACVNLGGMRGQEQLGQFINSNFSSFSSHSSSIVLFRVSALPFGLILTRKRKRDTPHGQGSQKCEWIDFSRSLRQRVNIELVGVWVWLTSVH